MFVLMQLLFHAGIYRSQAQRFSMAAQYENIRTDFALAK